MWCCIFFVKHHPAKQNDRILISPSLAERTAYELHKEPDGIFSFLNDLIFSEIL